MLGSTICGMVCIGRGVERYTKGGSDVLVYRVRSSEGLLGLPEAVSVMKASERYKVEFCL